MLLLFFIKAGESYACGEARDKVARRIFAGISLRGNAELVRGGVDLVTGDCLLNAKFC